MNHILEELSEAWVYFECAKLKNAYTVWVKPNSDQPSYDTATKYEMLCKKYAYVVATNPCFKITDFDAQDTKKLIAERYGGTGIGLNGGGGRCGNLGSVQLKGVGPNCMVGDHANKEHSYGGLDAHYAIIETIYTCVLNKVLPLGTVAIRGLIFTGKETAFNFSKGKPCWGVILVRDHCIRPAHFMRTHDFRPQKVYEHLLVDDVARVSRINNRLLEVFGHVDKFIQWVGKYLQNAANQFAFARAARIAHGSLTPSNLSWDGQWLDLSLARFLPGGANYTLRSQFYLEHTLPLSYALEMVHSFAKHNRLILNPKVLVDYYNEQFQGYLQHYIAYVLGLDLILVEKLPRDSWTSVAQLFIETIHAGKKIEIRKPYPDENDPVVALITASYLSLTDPIAAEAYFTTADISKDKSLRYSVSFREVIESYAALKTCTSTPQRDSLMIASLLKSLKRAWLAEMWYMPAVHDRVAKLCNEHTPDDIGPFIDNYERMVDWVFSEHDREIVLYKNNNTEITFSADRAMYFLRDSQISESHRQFPILYESIMGLPASRFMINEFDFRLFFGRILRVIISIENAMVKAELEHV